MKYSLEFKKDHKDVFGAYMMKGAEYDVEHFDIPYVDVMEGIVLPSRLIPYSKINQADPNDNAYVHFYQDDYIKELEKKIKDLEKIITTSKNLNIEDNVKKAEFIAKEKVKTIIKEGRAEKSIKYCLFANIIIAILILLLRNWRIRRM